MEAIGLPHLILLHLMKIKHTLYDSMQVEYLLETLILGHMHLVFVALKIINYFLKK
jgi:hypothetical protein